ncbi:TetR/AcrR family transcriptional regulator [Nocardia huaxiensis]|uniref:TetR family transcriptional regulator n=1 Tax=Nocardia huaxiensis TaxID=2755382 RepID=A0A7D6VGT3_9NOCA|nr:TetR family transcriptional regulator [Nocardia huaxiensis]QLY32395.1 TetR family transcriptional regulator [Nocardia huaxiensis]UFS93894.1 TetR family transcriptional regulator [Nocardia huaxiensis]
MNVEERRPAGSTRDDAPQPAEQRVIRRRPKNRRAQIAATSAAAFGSLGYHGVSMEDIATRLGISSAALYRHYPSKYALFREELLRLGTLTVESATPPPESEGLTPAQRLDAVLDKVIAETIANRATVTLVRWEQRYLDDADRQTLENQFAQALRSLRELIKAVRPELDGHDRAVRAVALLSIVSSIGDHHAALPVKSLTALLHSACRELIAAERMGIEYTETAAPRAVEIPQSFKHELLLKKAVELFHERGYPNVSVEDIAAAADLSAASAVYRYYRSKSDLLAAAFRRAADRVSGAIGPAVSSSSSPAEALTKLVDLYVAGSFAERELTYVYYAEFGHVSPEERTMLRNVQRLIVAEWVRLLVAVRPELSEGEARILVQAAFGLVVDLGRAFHDDQRMCPQDRVIRLMEVTLFGATAPAP